MNELVPTPIVDINGRQTTVHRKAAENGTRSSLLGSLRPTVVSNAPSNEPKLIKGALHPDSICLKVQSIKDSGQIQGDAVRNHKIAGDGVAFDDDELYDFLRFGIDATDAAVFKLCGYKPSDLSDDPEISPLLPGHLVRVFDGFKDHVFSNEEQVEIMRAAGIPATRAATALRNGVAEHHFNGVLSVEQVVELFMRSSYNRNPRISGPSKSGALDAIVSGEIPLELSQRVKVTNLQTAAYELRSYDGKRLRSIRDRAPARFETLIVKSARCNSSPLALHDLTRKYSDRVLELADPHLAEKRIGKTDATYGVDNAKYLEAIIRAAPKGITGDWVKTKDGSFRPFSREYSALRGEDMVAMREAGATLEQCWDLLGVRKMRLEEAVAVARGETILALSEGVL